MADSILGRFVWHELMSADPKAAATFFSKVIGWKPQAWGEDKSYTMLMVGKSGRGGVMALPSPSSPPMWMVYIGTPDVDNTVKTAVSLGAKVLKGVTPIPTVGRFAVIQDPQGAVFAPFTPEGQQGGPPPTGMPGVMDWSWHELATTDGPGALKFYGDVFGWQPTESMDMGPMGMYHMYGLGGRTMGGIFAKPKEMPGPPAWLAYVRVSDAKKTAKAITNTGGKVINGPMQVPGGDWIAQALDPQGVMFAVHSVAAQAAAPAARKRKATKKAKPAARKAAKKAKPAARKAAKKAKPAARKAVGVRKAAAKGAKKKVARPAARKSAKKR